MKKIFNILLAASALLAFTQVTRAQDYTIENGVGVRKTIGLPDKNGIYKITLESFVTGDVTVTTTAIPSNIVLVLDVSSSMVRKNNNLTSPTETYDMYQNGGNNGIPDTYQVQWTYDKIGDNNGTNPFCVKYPETWDGKFYPVLRERVNGNTGNYRLYFVDNNNVRHYLQGKYWDADRGIKDTPTAGVGGTGTTIWQGPLYTKTTSITRLKALQDAVYTFLDMVKHNALYESEDDSKPRKTPLANKVSIVKFSGLYVNDPRPLTDGRNSAKELAALTEGNAHTFDLNDDDGERKPTTEVLKGWTDVTNDEAVEAMKNQVATLGLGHGTSQDFGLVLADILLHNLPSDTPAQSAKTVVLFTDGDPWREDRNTMGDDYVPSGSTAIHNAAINEAHLIKQIPTFKNGTEQQYTNVFTLGCINNPGGNTLNLLQYSSSNYPDATSLNNHGDQKSSDYYFPANSVSSLANAFKTIASSSESPEITDLTESTTTVDIVSKNFLLPKNATTEDIKIYTADCNGGTMVGDVFYPTFEPREPSTLVAVIGKDSNDNDMISVNGFNYTENFVGQVKNDDGGVIGYTGKELIIVIPIRMNPDALGGPNALTNAEGSGIFDKDGKQVGTFVSPHVSLPYNIQIKKTGLRKGESAKFTIEKGIGTWVNDVATPPTTGWTYMTTVLITGTDEDVTTSDEVWVRGLPATEVVGGVQQPVFFRISEENWSWSYTPDGKPQITDNTKSLNPFEFGNTKKDDINIDVKIRHAESKATNIFKGENGATKTGVYIDSKNNTGTGRP